MAAVAAGSGEQVNGRYSRSSFAKHSFKYFVLALAKLFRDFPTVTECPRGSVNKLVNSPFNSYLHF